MIQRTLLARGQLNAVQQAMLNWSQLHPYNAAHICKITGPARPSDLRAAVRQALLVNRLGRVEFDLRTRSYQHLTDDDPDVAHVPDGAALESAMSEHVSRELNRPFTRPHCRPFRFSLLGSGPEFHYLHVGYDHWVADSVTMRLLLHHVLARYLELPGASELPPLSLPPGPSRALFTRRFLAGDIARAMKQALTGWMTSRRIAQVPYLSSREMSVQYALLRTGPHTVPRLLEFARSLDSSVQDVIQAALARALVAALPRRSRLRTQAAAIAASVDTRAAARMDLSNSLGVFLAYYVVRCHAHGSSLADVTREIAAQTARIKADRRYLQSQTNMRLVNAVWPWLSPRRQVYFLRSVLPVTAGVSNVRLRGSWLDEAAGEHILEYARAAPTGPTVPLMLTPTTRGETLNVGVTYRSIGFSRARIDSVMNALLEQIEHPN